ncbi:unnamed protein product [Sphenostylis stenocarpa]|uniref:Uncharacterized protein n=1 Tax=Sphenostylis stenocarpa TaxID=92480 RepID=A0AA86SVR9_9FABA|nr:unnamed protein product [Sphenostylis stenocarpa]
MEKDIEKATIGFLEKEEEQAEEWCFECKDGGEMIICDHPNCGKVYHPACVGKDAAFFDSVKSWFCGRHVCFKCNEPSKFHCLGCPNSVCRKCFAFSEEFTVVRGVKGLCIECWKLMEIIEQNLDHDEDGNKISLTDRETYECLFKEYWEIIKVKERLASEDVFAAQPDFKKCKHFLQHKKNRKGEGEEVQDELKEGLNSNDIFAAGPDCKKFKRVLHHTKISKGEEEEKVHNEVKEGLINDDIFAAGTQYKKFRSFLHHKKVSEVEEEEENDLISWASDEDSKPAHQPAKRKKRNSEEFVGWGSKPLISFLSSIGKYETEPLTKWAVNSVIHEYIKEKNLDHHRYKGKFFPDDRLFPIFRKKVVSKKDIYSLLEFHFAKNMDDSSEDKSDVKIRKSSEDKHHNEKKACTESRLSSLIGKPPLRKGDFLIKYSRFASITVHNINLIYLKRSLVLELSKRSESFLSKIVGTFVRARVYSNDSRQKSYHLVRVLGVEFDEMSNRTLLQVSLMAKAIPISELSDEEFTEQECEDFQQKVKAGLLPKLAVAEVQEKAESLHEDITRHLLNCLCYTKIALLEERERLEQSWKQDQLLRNVPTVRAELLEAEYDDSEDGQDTNTQD